MENPFASMGAIVAKPAFEILKKKLVNDYANQIHDELVSNCSVQDIAAVIAGASGNDQDQLEILFHSSKAQEFYQFILALLYDEYRDIAYDSALEAIDHD